MASEDAAIAVDPAVEREYNLRQRHPEREAVYRRFAERSAALRADLPHRRDLRYGAGPRCLLDLFTPAAAGSAPAPLLVFIHGGYWRALEKDIFSFVAEPYVARGVAVALLGYDLAPAVRLPDIVTECETAMRWIAGQAAALNVRADGVVLSGHSAGAHLCATLAARDRDALGGLGVGGVVGISGVYDLHPLLRASMNRDVRMTPADCALLSPIGFARFEAPRFVLAVGERETRGFQEQSRRFAERLREQGRMADLQIVPGRTHFDVLDDLADAGSALAGATLALLPPAASSAT